MAMTLPTLNIIGAGKVGRVLGQLFHRHKIYAIQDVCNSTLLSSVAACEFIGAGTARTENDELRFAQLWMLAVPDDQIKICSAALQKHHLLRPDDIVFHCSGALAANELAFGEPYGAKAASLHPLRSFADPMEVAENFNATICTVEGDRTAVSHLTASLQKIGARVVAIDQSGKTLYHTAAVFASNYLVTLIDASLQTFQAAGIRSEMAQQMVKPLAQETLNNIFRLGSQQALTGPIARGDLGTVNRHQDALRRWDRGFAALYAALADATQTMKDRE